MSKKMVLFPGGAAMGLIRLVSCYIVCPRSLFLVMKPPGSTSSYSASR